MWADGGKVTEALKRRLGTGKLLTVYMSRRDDLLRFLRARTGSAEEAEDVLQDVYLRLCSMAQSTTARIVDPTAFLFKLCLNLSIDRRRADIRRERREQAFQGVNLHFEHGEVIADLPSPEESAAARLMLDRIRQAVDCMPPQQRRVFKLHKVEGLSHAEIAETLNMSRSGVEKHMIAALKRLAGFV
jgi:RNA polymerase sigma-70 factor (ECF subfamily)